MSASINHRLKQVRPSDKTELEEIQKIYEHSFPAQERKPSEFLRRAAGCVDYRLLALVSGGLVEGFALVYEIPRRVCLIEYMAVDVTRRGRGVGSLLFNCVAQEVVPLPVLIEVEATNRVHPDTASSARRKAFYRRLGCRELAGFPYSMPKVGAGRPPPMSLMTFRYPGDCLPRNELRQYLTVVFERVYGLADANERLDQLLCGQPECVPLA